MASVLVEEAGTPPRPPGAPGHLPRLRSPRGTPTTTSSVTTSSKTLPVVVAILKIEFCTFSFSIVAVHAILFYPLCHRTQKPEQDAGRAGVRSESAALQGLTRGRGCDRSLGSHLTLSQKTVIPAG